MSKNIPQFKDLVPGQNKKYFDHDKNLHFEVRVLANRGGDFRFGKVIDYIQGEMTSKPSSQIIMESTPYEITTYFAFAVLDSYAKFTIGRGLNELFNEPHQVELIDHEKGEIHQFTGNLESGQLRFDVTYKKDSDFKMPQRGMLKYREGENYSTDFEKFLKKFTPDFKVRFTHEEQEKTVV